MQCTVFNGASAFYYSVLVLRLLIVSDSSGTLHPLWRTLDKDLGAYLKNYLEVCSGIRLEMEKDEFLGSLTRG